MWIPIIVIAWEIGTTPLWVNFPMVNFPFSSKETCESYVSEVRKSVIKERKFIDGYSICIETPKKIKPPGTIEVPMKGELQL